MANNLRKVVEMYLKKNSNLKTLQNFREIFNLFTWFYVLLTNTKILIIIILAQK